MCVVKAPLLVKDMITLRECRYCLDATVQLKSITVRNKVEDHVTCSEGLRNRGSVLEMRCLNNP